MIFFFKPDDFFFKPDDLLRRVETGNTSRAHSLKLSSHFFSLPSFYLTRRSIIGATDHKQNVPAPPHSSQGPHDETFGLSEKQQQRWTLCCLHGADHRESVVRAHGRLSGCCSTHRRRQRGSWSQVASRRPGAPTGCWQAGIIPSSDYHGNLFLRNSR